MLTVEKMFHVYALFKIKLVFFDFHSSSPVLNGDNKNDCYKLSSKSYYTKLYMINLLEQILEFDETTELE